MLEPIIFEPKSDSGFPFLIILIIVVALGIYGVLRSVKGGSGPVTWILGFIVIVAIGIGVMIIQSRQKAEVISITADRIETPSWSILFRNIKSVSEDQISATQYVGGRPVVNMQRRLIVNTDEGQKVIAYESTYDIYAIKPALDLALKKFRELKY